MLRSSHTSIFLRPAAMDVLCLTALPDEFLALQRAIHHPWRETLAACGTPYFTANYADLRLALVYLSPQAITSPQRLISLVASLQPQVIVMVGVCQGNHTAVMLGDIIVAQTIWSLPTATTTQTNFYHLNHPWQSILLGQPPHWRQQIQTPRPKSTLHQRSWLLHTLYDHELKPDHCLSPQEHPERYYHCPDWPVIFEQLVAEQLLNPDPLRLTAAALDLIREDQSLHLATGFPHDPAVPAVHLGAIADITEADPFVLDDPNLFNIEPQILGLDVGSYGIASLAAQVERPLMVIKAVQSYRPLQPHDSFRAYAAETVSQFFLGFLRNLTQTTVPHRY
ncbi:5'-methylthioadenosine/S-adenosylhomocysteine nucleosidase [Synechococcus moorigangaii CMS01]|nr:5'-methylthioadenosine/S-adenosylhomocysteine nucleosidase [Synechococcus moorigangaii CMS01]